MKKRKTYIDLTRDLIDLTGESESESESEIKNEFNLATLLQHTRSQQEYKPDLKTLALLHKLPDDPFIQMILDLNPSDLLALLRVDRNLAQRYQATFEKQLKQRYPSFTHDEQLCYFGMDNGQYCGIKSPFLVYKGKKLDCTSVCQKVDQWLLPFVSAITEKQPITLYLRARDQKNQFKPQCDLEVKNVFLRKFNLFIDCKDLRMWIGFGSNPQSHKHHKWGITTFQGAERISEFSGIFFSFQEVSKMILSFLSHGGSLCEPKWTMTFAVTTTETTANNFHRYEKKLISYNEAKCKDLSNLWWVRPATSVISISFNFSVSEIFEEDQLIAYDYEFEMKK